MTKKSPPAKVVESAGGVVLNPKGLVLVVNQNNNSWSLPKGHLDEGESAREAARREIYEESGVKDLTFVKNLGSYERSRIGKNGGSDPSETKRITLFLFKTQQTVLRPLDPRNPEARWVERSRVAALLTHPRDKEFFLGILEALPKQGAAA
jgi:ADP-ribose pyrophosphatase YjhB (NUDIX family)